MSADGLIDPRQPDAGAVVLTCYRCSRPITPTNLTTTHAECTTHEGLVPYQVEVLGAR